MKNKNRNTRVQKNHKNSIKITGKENEKIKDVDIKKLQASIQKSIITKKKKRSTVLKILIVIIFILILSLFLLMPKIIFNGSKQEVLNYNDKYIEKGGTAKYLGKDYSKEIKISGTVNTSQIGKYEITYKLKVSIFNIKRVRIVKVVDKKKPEIKVESKTEINICPDKEYEVPKYTAHDEYDGDLTDKVKVKHLKDQIIYSVKDKSNNETKKIVLLKRIDKEKPEITLKGSNTIYLTPDMVYKEPGYTATDNCDGDITRKVIISGTVKDKVIGNYSKKYEVTDSNGNKSEVIRKIIISEKTDPDSGEIKKGAVYLTFDDGPQNGTTDKILDILKEEGIKATFFVTKNGPDRLIKRIFDEGHSIALHTASHDYSKIYKSVDAYFDDLYLISDRVEKITGYKSKIMRFPGGSSNTISRRYNVGIMSSLANEVFNRGYRYYDWNIDSDDAGRATNSKQVYTNVTTSLSKSRMNVVLMHDVKKWTADAVRDIIKYGKENGYTFEKIDMDTYMTRQKIKN